MLEFHWQDLIFLLAAGFIGSFVDAAVGGGGLITLPAFMATGIPTPFALGSNKLASSIGAVTSFFTFARSGKVDRKILKMMPLSFLGSAAGACIASLLPEQLLRYIVVLALVGVACYTYYRKNWDGVNEMTEMTRSVALGIAAMAWFLGMYDGFFGPGTGSFLIFGFLYFGYNFVTAAGNTKALNLASNLGGLVAFFPDAGPGVSGLCPAHGAGGDPGRPAGSEDCHKKRCGLHPHPVPGHDRPADRQAGL